MDAKIELLYEAITARNDILVQELLKEGVAINLTDGDNWSALDYAVDNWHPPIIKKLIEAGGDVNHVAQKVDEDFGALLFEAVKRGALKLVDFLIEKGADVNYDYYGFFTPIMVAVQEEQHKIIRRLAKAGANPNLGNLENRNALMFAVEEKSEATAKVVIEIGADIHIVTKFDWTALNFAVYRGSLPLVTALLAKGAVLNLEGTDGTKQAPPIFTAIEARQWAILRFLIEKGAAIEITYLDLPLLLLTIDCKNFVASKILIEAGADVFVIAGLGGTAVYILCNALKEMKETLQSAKAANASDYQKKVANKIIEENKFEQAVEILQILLKKGCAAHVLYDDYRDGQISPLELTLESKFLPAIKLLLKYGAKVKYPNRFNQTVDLIQKLNIQDKARLDCLSKNG